MDTYVWRYWLPDCKARCPKNNWDNFRVFSCCPPDRWWSGPRRVFAVGPLAFAPVDPRRSSAAAAAQDRTSPEPTRYTGRPPRIQVPTSLSSRSGGFEFYFSFLLMIVCNIPRSETGKLWSVRGRRCVFKPVTVRGSSAEGTSAIFIFFFWSIFTLRFHSRLRTEPADRNRGRRVPNVVRTDPKQFRIRI